MHLWLGLVTGLVIVIVSLSGCLYVFQDDITPLIYKDRLFVEKPAGAQRLPLSSMKDIAVAAMSGEAELSRIIVPAPGDRTVIFAFDKYHEHAWSYAAYVEVNKTVFVDPYTGRITYIENTKWEFFNVVFWLHTSLLLGYDLGNPIITVSVYVTVFLLISGIILWWPSKNERGYLWFAWTSKTKWRRRNYDLHRIVGFYVLPFGLLFALTGLFWSSPAFGTFARWLADGGLEHVEKELPAPHANAKLSVHPIDLIYHRADSIAPRAPYVMIRPPFRPAFPYIVRAYVSGRNYERREFYFDQFSGALIDALSFETRTNSEKLSVLNYDLHVGTVGGMTTKIIAFIACLGVASLPVTGFYIWWLKKRRSVGLKSINQQVGKS